jgi:predicted aspartyl protease
MWKERALCQGMPRQNKEVPQTISSSRSNDGEPRGGRRGRRIRASGKRPRSGVSPSDHNLRGKYIAQGIGTTEETPYIVSSTGWYSREEKMMIRIKIRGSNNIEHYTMALIDCGASESFIDKKYAAANKIPTHRKTIPRRVLTVDGSEVAGGPVTHNAQVGMTINHHTENIRLHCITIRNALVILGLPWLKLHNTTIDWRTYRLSFHSDKCTEHGLTASPQATAVAEERTKEQYYRKTPDERENDLWKTAAKNNAFRHRGCIQSHRMHRM